ncbi:MAG TPA: phosphohydrolase, partial [Bacillota bacterium]|nr:phosphohydrolase [Bacillota bacterium]
GRVPESLEAKVLFDADKLDVLGATGIARSYILAGEYGEPIFSTVSLVEYIHENLVGGTVEGRVKDIAIHTANLEYELKMKRIPERLHTPQAKAMAVERLKFMAQYFQRLEQEITGEL